ncbi:hypothetical protein H0O00_00070 [Candidatus Micrarchaeota archaeon]|nr:hypothetical protein [Candidatus Micrarchaeota archaeon]
MDSKQILLSALVFAVVSQVINTLGAFVSMGYYTDPANFGLWSNLMMPVAGPPGTEFYLASFVFTFITGCIFAWVYAIIRKSVPGKGLSNGLNYGLMLFLLVGVPYTLTNILLLAIPIGLLMEWALETLVIYVLCGLAFAKIVK